MAEKFKTISANRAEPLKRAILGTLRVCSQDKDKNYRVRLELLNEQPNRNNWKFIAIREHINEFGNIPLLYATIGREKIGDGHNFDIVIGKNGRKRASYLSATSEKPWGWIPDMIAGRANAHIENIAGVEWVVADGYLPYQYNPEMIEELERHNGQMPISIEALVQENHMEGDIEVETKYSVVGVTILGIDVTPAVAGAKVRKLSFDDSTLEELKLRVASLANEGINTEPQTQNQKPNKGDVKAMKKILNLDDLKDKFAGYTVLAAKGLSVALLSDKGRACSYTFQEGESTVLPERIEKTTVNCSFGEGDDAIPVSEEVLIGTLQSKLNAAQTALEELTAEKAKEVQELTAKLNKMQEAEDKRRKDAVRAAISSELKKNQECFAADIANNLCDDMLTDECVNKYAGMTDSEGCFNGDVMAARDVASRCMNKVRDAAEIRKNSQKKQSVWGLPKDGERPADASDIELLVNEYK